MIANKPLAVVIAGPTASGKTALGIWLARQLGTEILSADSRQCYRELNIGVARPTPEELRKVHHYFVATHSIFEDLNAGTYAKYGLTVLNTLFARRPVAIIVGGTGLYLKALSEGVDDMPAIDPRIRTAVKDRYAERGMAWLREETALRDPLFWQQAEQSNPQRLMRGLEFMLSTGQSIISYRSHQKVQRDFNILKIGLELPRPQLYDRINRRVDQMMDAGLEAEAAGLLAHQDLNALQTVGYKELFGYLKGDTSLEAAVDTIKKNTRHYAKRQMTWFKKDPEFHWFSPEEKENILFCIQSYL